MRLNYGKNKIQKKIFENIILGYSTCHILNSTWKIVGALIYNSIMTVSKHTYQVPSATYY